MASNNELAIVAAAASLGAGWLAIERTLRVFESERIRLDIDSDKYAWRVMSAAASSVASAAFWMSALVHIGASVAHVRGDLY